MKVEFWILWIFLIHSLPARSPGRHKSFLANSPVTKIIKLKKRKEKACRESTSGEDYCLSAWAQYRLFPERAEYWCVGGRVPAQELWLREGQLCCSRPLFPETEVKGWMGCGMKYSAKERQDLPTGLRRLVRKRVLRVLRKELWASNLWPCPHRKVLSQILSAPPPFLTLSCRFFSFSLHWQGVGWWFSRS